MEFFSFDREYTRRLAAADPDTERHFASYFAPLLEAKLRQRLRSEQEVNDLRQEVFLRVLQCLRGGSGVQQPERLGGFVYSVCNNVLFEYFRSAGKNTSWNDELNIRPCDTNLEKDLLTRESQEQVRTLLNELTERDRGVLRAIFLEERDKDVVCREFGVGRDYLRVVLHRARIRLRQLMVAATAVGQEHK